jgi:hypothetical protein
MKKTDDIKKSKKNPTTNYPKDTHKDFCKRCFPKHKGICPMTKKPILSKDCDL